MLVAHRTLPVPLVLAVIGLGAFVTALDQTVVVTALPSIMLDLKIPITELDRASWIVTAYLLGYTVAMPLIGRLGDVYGYARVYQASLIVFVVGTILVAVSSSLEWMVGARLVQAIGGGATVPIGMAIGTSLLPPERRGWALGIVGGAAEAGSMLGPVYGGAIVELANWRWIFWLNVPQAAVLFVALLWLPHRHNPGARVDYWGGVLLAATLVVLSVGLSQRGLFTLSSPLPFFIGVSGLLLATLLVLLQRRTSQPLLPGFMFRSWVFITANITQFLVGISLIIAMVAVPLMANTVMGQDPFTGALWLLRMTGPIPLGAVIGGGLLRWVGIRPVTIVGLGLTALGLSLVSTWPIAVVEPALTLHLVITGLGFGLVIAPILTSALNAVSEDYRGTAASLVVVARMLGMTLGLAALSAWGVEHFQVLTAGLEFPLPPPGETGEGMEQRFMEYNRQVSAAGLSLFQSFFRVAAGVSLAAVIPALIMRGDRNGSPTG